MSCRGLERAPQKSPSLQKNTPKKNKVVLPVGAGKCSCIAVAFTCVFVVDSRLPLYTSRHHFRLWTVPELAEWQGM